MKLSRLATSSLDLDQVAGLRRMYLKMRKRLSLEKREQIFLACRSTNFRYQFRKRP